MLSSSFIHAKLSKMASSAITWSDHQSEATAREVEAAVSATDEILLTRDYNRSSKKCYFTPFKYCIRNKDSSREISDQKPVGASILSAGQVKKAEKMQNRQQTFNSHSSSSSDHQTKASSK